MITQEPNDPTVMAQWRRYNQVPKKIKYAIEFFGRGDYEESLSQLAIAVDISGLRKRPNLNQKVGLRIKKFLRDHMTFLMYMTIGAKVSGFEVEAEDGNKSDFADLFYELIRCKLLHEGALDVNMIFMQELKGIRFNTNGFDYEISTDFLIGLMLIIIGDKVNKDEMGPIEGLKFGGTEVSGKYWGKMPDIHRLAGFTGASD